jgi:NhaA family Na+:H+ antiporter
VLVCFYSRHVHLVALAVGVVCVAAMVPVRVAASRWRWPVLVLGAASWWALAVAGVEAAIVGVAIGLLLPAGGSRASSPAQREHRLAPGVNLAVLPLFALANAGLSFSGSGLGSTPALRIFAAVLLARVIGKPVGITGAARAMRHVRSGRFDVGLPRRQEFGAGAFASIGFTVPLLIIHVALPEGPLAAGATAGLLAASVVGAIGGWVMLRNTLRACTETT